MSRLTMLKAVKNLPVPSVFAVALGTLIGFNATVVSAAPRTCRSWPTSRTRMVSSTTM